MKEKIVIPASTPYNPLDKKNLGANIAEALLNTTVQPLPPMPFIGAGIYTIYYSGPFTPYRLISESNCDKKNMLPIYIGKAVPAGTRKGGFGLGANPGMVLYRRLMEHAETINQTENLSLDDFCCRYLSVDDIWIPLAESILIEMFSPVWNKLLDGFGNHDPGSGRYNQQASPWDTLHPGRDWVSNLKPNEDTSEQIANRVIVFLDNNKGKRD